MKMSSEQATQILGDLQSEVAGHEATVASVGARRQRFAFSASQGNEEAIAALAQAEADEAGALNAIRNLLLAIDEARKILSAAYARNAKAHAAAVATAYAAKGRELIALDGAICDAIKALRGQLDLRVRLVQEICDLGLLSHFEMQRLGDADTVGNAIFDGLYNHLGSHAKPNHFQGAVDRIAILDGAVLKIDVGRPTLTAIEKELERQCGPKPRAA